MSLVLHSTAHRKSGLVSTRIFQACASKTLTICDDNSFILKHFGDSVLSFKYGDDPAENFRRIMEQVEWIHENPVKAREKACAAHRIFVEKFSLQKEVANLFASHQANVAQYVEQFCSRNISVSVDVLYIHNDGKVTDLEDFFEDLGAQTSVQPRAVVFTLPDHAGEIQNLAGQYDFECEVVECMEEGETEGCLPLDGRLVAIYLKDYVKNKQFAFYSNHCRWKRLHLAQLVRALEDGDSVVAMSGVYVRNETFSQYLDEDYYLLMHSIGLDSRSITEHDIGVFAASKFLSPSLLFRTSAFQNYTLLCSIRFFDKGWAFFLVVWKYLQTRKLPLFIPKLSTVLIRNDEHWDIDSYFETRQSEEFERSLAHVFFKNDPYYFSLRRSSYATGSGILGQSSFNGYMHDILCKRPLLLKVYRGCFKTACFVLRIPYVEILKEERK